MQRIKGFFLFILNDKQKYWGPAFFNCFNMEFIICELRCLKCIIAPANWNMHIICIHSKDRKTIEIPNIAKETL